VNSKYSTDLFLSISKIRQQVIETLHSPSWKSIYVILFYPILGRCARLVYTYDDCNVPVRLVPHNFTHLQIITIAQSSYFSDMYGQKSALAVNRENIF